jgi:hypothetical protein
MLVFGWEVLVVIRLRDVALSCFVLYLFHVVRNLTIAYVFVFGVFLIAFISMAFNKEKFKKSVVNSLTLGVIFCWVWATLMTFLWASDYGEVSVGLVRLWTSFPLVVICAYVVLSWELKKPFVLITFFFFLAALSLILQVFIGPILWFAEASERAGGIRFASLVGSLTSYGVMVGVPILAALFFFNRVIGFFIVSVLIAGALISLQKAAMASVVMSLVIAWWLRLFTIAVVFKVIISVLVACLPLYLFFHENTQIQAIANYFIGTLTADVELTSDDSFSLSMFDRLTHLPMTAAQFFGVKTLLFGAGAFGASGTLGYPEIPMAHNGIIELILVFGYIVGGGIVIFMLYGFWKSIYFLLKRPIDVNFERIFLHSCYVIWFVNYIFSGGVLFHPVGAAIFWVIVFKLYFSDGVFNTLLMNEYRLRKKLV